ncbi:MAG: hypothetical protein KAT68_11820 [Bacteroidales bacterium]|nr:hypothetical protein [Bacteroidales bacterium]
MNLTERIEYLVLFGELLSSLTQKLNDNISKASNISSKTDKLAGKYFDLFKKKIEEAEIQNPWFTKKNILLRLISLSNSLSHKNLNNWINKYYSFSEKTKQKKIAVIMAGNIPLVGFHDMLCVLITGNIFVGKPSSKDIILYELVSELLQAVNTEFKELMIIEKNKLNDFDAIIATGSNNASRYFEYYFSKYPNIIRKNRTGIAVLSGNETMNDLQKLADDIFLYFGLGCRSVSKIYFPQNYDFNLFFKSIQSYKYIINHNKYANNYNYNKSILQMNNIQFFDNGFVILKNDNHIYSPISIINYEYYNNIKQIIKNISNQRENIQCIVSNIKEITDKIDFGCSQYPELWNYSDNIDTIKFIKNIN